MVNENNTDTLVTQKNDTATNYANTTMIGKHMIKWTNRWADSEWPKDLNETVKAMAEFVRNTSIEDA